MDDYEPRNFSNLADTPFGRGLWRFLNERENVVRMETATYLGRPALEAMSPELEREFGAEHFADKQKKRMAGHMTKQVLARSGLRLDRTGVRINTPGNLFSTAARYRPAA